MRRKSIRASLIGTLLFACIPVGTPRLLAEAPGRVSKIPPASVSASIVLKDESWLQRAPRMVDRVAALGHTQVNFVTTVHCDITRDLRLARYGFVRGRWGELDEMNDKVRDQIRAYWEAAFARAVAHGMDIGVLAHIDAGGEIYEWRNLIDFDPLANYGGYTYQELMVDTLIEALSNTIANETKVDVALCGEMGQSLFAYPHSYRSMISRLRLRAPLPNLRIGISLNHSDVEGRNQPSAGQRRALQDLIAACDFVGFSNYRPFQLPPTPQTFVTSVDHFLAELAQFGIHVPKTTPLQFSELGLGGGDAHGTTDQPQVAAASPWEGTSRVSANPWRTDAMRRLRREYYRAALEFLAQQPASHRVTLAYIWSEGSWDPQGIDQPEFADPEIVRMITAHNRAAGQD